MEEDELKILERDEEYVLSPKIEGMYAEADFLLRSGESVFGCISTDSTGTVLRWVIEDDDTYLGIGVFHQRDA